MNKTVSAIKGAICGLSMVIVASSCAMDADLNGELFKAVNDGNFTAARNLLTRGANVNARNNSKCTPLHAAVFHRRKDLVKLLLKNVADIGAEDEFGRTPFGVAFERYFGTKNTKLKNVNLSILKLLLYADGVAIDAEDAKDKRGRTILHLAVEEGNQELIQFLLGSHHRSTIINAVDKYGHTPLHTAVFKGNKDIVELLLNSGADRNVKDGKGRTPFAAILEHYVAASCNRDYLVKLLLNSVVDRKDHYYDYVRATSFDGALERYSATKNFDLGILELLLNTKKNIDIGTKDEYGHTMLHLAILNNDNELVRILLESRQVSTIINAGDNHDFTPLHLAIFHRRNDFIKLLLDNGADKNAQAEGDRTPIDLAMEAVEAAERTADFLHNYQNAQDISRVTY